MCSRIFKTVFPTGSITTSTGTFLASFGLCYTLTASIDILRDLFKPLKHLKASMDTLTASKDTLTASKALSRPLQSTCTVLACKRQFTRTFSRLWECCWGRESVVYSRSLFGLPYKGTLTAFISTLLASTDTFLASTTLTRPYFDTYGPLQTLSLLSISLKASSGTLTVSTSTLITFTCTLTDFRGLLEAMRVLLEAVRVFAGTFVMSTKSKQKRIETKPKRFDVFQNLKWNVSIYSKNFGTKPKLFDVFQFLFCKSKTFLFIPKILEQNQNFWYVPPFF